MTALGGWEVATLRRLADHPAVVPRETLGYLQPYVSYSISLLCGSG